MASSEKNALTLIVLEICLKEMWLWIGG